MVQEALALRTGSGPVVGGADSASLEEGVDGAGLSDKDLRRVEKQRKEDEKRRQRERIKAEKLAKQEHDRLAKLKEKEDKNKKRTQAKETVISASPPEYADSEEAGRSSANSPAEWNRSSQPVLPNYEHVTEEISGQASGPGIYASNTLPSNYTISNNGRSKELLVPVIPAERTVAPGETKLASGTKYTVRLLSDQHAEFILSKNAVGQELFDKVCAFINLQEKDYFGIRFKDTDNEDSWLNMEKTVKQQVKNERSVTEFQVKFYPPQPTELKEDLTRYYLCMQVHRDLITEKLPASFTTYAILGSLMVQSELGDYDRSIHRGNYVSEVPLAPPAKQNAELEEKVMELHRSNTRGMAPVEADLRYLENAKRLAFYGVDLHKAKDKENMDVRVGVSGSGVHVYRDNLRINRFAWPKILKISYRRYNFYIKIRPLEFEETEKEICFKCPYEKAAKRLWKVCVEHHTFFRMKSSEEPSDYSTLRWPRLGSRFRYSGRTYSEAKASSERLDRPNPEFNRTWSKRNPYSVSVDHGLSRVGREDSGDGRPASVSDYETHRGNGPNNIYDRPGYGYAGPYDAAGGDISGNTVYQTHYNRMHPRGDGESPGGASSLLTNNVTNQESRMSTTIPGGTLDSNSRGSSVFSSPNSTMKSRTEFEYVPGNGGRWGASPIHPFDRDQALANSTPLKSYKPGGGGRDSPVYSTSAQGFRLDAGDLSPSGLPSTRYSRQEYYAGGPDGTITDPSKISKIPIGGVGVMTTTYGNVTEYSSRTKTTTSTIKSTIENYPGVGGDSSTTLTTRSIHGPTTSSSSEPLGSPTRKTETHSLTSGPTIVSTKIKTIESTTFEVDRNGEKETHLEEKVTIMTDGEDIDHDRALAEAIQNATNLNPKLQVEKIEIDSSETDH